MPEEPQPTTHNAERGAHSTCRERSETGFSPKNTERNVCCSAVGEISWRYGETWRSIYGDHVLEFVKEQLRAGDHKWRLNHNGEIMEINYGDQNFIHYGVENTYLERFKDRNV